FFERSGLAAIGSRTRLLSERLLRDAREINLLYGSDLKPKWFPVFYLLLQDGACVVKDLATSTGQSHPAVVKVVGELVKAGLVERKPHPTDGRSSLISLTAKGQALGERTREVVPPVEATVKEIMAECEHNLWQALREWEQALDRRSLLQRAIAIRRGNAAEKFAIVSYNFSTIHRQAWYDLNEAWVSQYFEMEEADYVSLRDPEGYILDKGGHILIAEYEGRPVGTCGLIKMDDPLYDYELAKMCIAPEVHGLGFGYLLGRAALVLAKDKGAKAVYLETNHQLQPAIALYRKLGFEDVVGNPSPYARCDVRMGMEV
ncbi:MAG: bifunctional helix-turn-helix transcriptional regulator/GNAT family N-acetyltransferase, partial [Bacteroidota bacterium]